VGGSSDDRGTRLLGAVAAGVHKVASLLVIATGLAFGVVAVSLVFPSKGGLLPSRASHHHQQRPEPVNLARLTAATTHTTLPRAPHDPAPQATNDGEVVRPLRMVAVYARPGERPFGKVGPQQIGETWLPVVDRKGGWSQVLLPSKPNQSSGWVRTSQVERRSTPYLVRVHRSSMTLELFNSDQLMGTWPVAVGAPSTPTPLGRTFLLGSITDPNQSYSPVILPLGTHSDTLDSYGGGPGTVALHTWPDASVFGTAASHGCIRVPPDALDKLTQVPLGTLVVIDDK
jgi:lipoprotein-anchoring transpeptidase ErfK/SrfK